MTPDEPISGIILSGGRGRRLGGADKGLMPWQGAPRVEAVINALKPQVDEIVISANRNLESYRRLGWPVYRDEFLGYQGPLAGIHAAAAGCQHGLIAVVPCDAPDFPADFVQRLAAGLVKEESDLCYAHDGERPQRLFMVFKKKLRHVLQRYLASGDRSVRGWQQSLYHCSEVRVPGNFPNLNDA